MSENGYGATFESLCRADAATPETLSRSEGLTQPPPPSFAGVEEETPSSPSRSRFRSRSLCHGACRGPAATPGTPIPASTGHGAPQLPGAKTSFNKSLQRHVLYVPDHIPFDLHPRPRPPIVRAARKV